MKKTVLKNLSVSILFSLFCFGMILDIPQNVEAKTTEENDQMTSVQKLEQIENLLGTLISLQRDLNAKDPKAVALINSNSLVKSNKEIQVRELPSLNAKVLGKQIVGIEGNVSDKLRFKDGKIWWKIDFETGVDGWVLESSLTRIPSVVLGLDTDADGKPDLKIRLVGEYELDKFVVERGIAGSQIRYIGKDLNSSTLGAYKGYMNKSEFIRTLKISKQEALDNCMLNASNNPKEDVYCTWNKEVIFDKRNK